MVQAVGPEQIPLDQLPAPPLQKSRLTGNPHQAAHVVPLIDTRADHLPS